MRKLRLAEPPPAVATRDDVIEARAIKIITPVFGGGVTSGSSDAPHQKELDPITPIRSAAVRGHLRQWWRLACGRGLSPEVLRARERLLWGAARDEADGGRGYVSIDVDTSKLGAPKRLDVYDPNKPKKASDIDLAYGAFPLQPAQGAPDKRPGVLHQFHSGTFAVTMRRHPLSKEQQGAMRKAWGMRVEVPAEQLTSRLDDEARKALAAWSTYGGVGGRTRRGFGALEPAEATAAPEPAPVTRGPRAYGSPVAALKATLSALRTYRQGNGLGRNPPAAGGYAGRSRWPEPDAIRRLLRMHDRRHRPEHAAGVVFPRAAFGLPIVFHFKDNADPRDSMLQLAGGGRLPSPLLLRPLRRADGKYDAVALLLDGLRPGDDLELQAGQETLRASADLDARAADAIRPHREHRDPDHPNSVLHAFLQFFARG